MAERLTIARPYAKAVFALARAQQKLPRWSEALGVAATVVADERVKPLLTSPRVTAAELVELISGIGGERFEGEVRNFLSTLAASKRLGFLPEIAAVYAGLRADAERTLSVTITSAVPLSAEQQARFKAALAKRSQREIALNCTLDPALLGGAVIRADDLVIDGSLAGGLQQLAAQVAN